MSSFVALYLVAKALKLFFCKIRPDPGLVTTIQFNGIISRSVLSPPKLSNTFLTKQEATIILSSRNLYLSYYFQPRFFFSRLTTNSLSKLSVYTDTVPILTTDNEIHLSLFSHSPNLSICHLSEGVLVRTQNLHLHHILAISAA